MDLGFLRDANWFGPERARAYLWLIAIPSVMLPLFLVLTSRGGVDRNGFLLGTDFISFWTAGHMLAGSADVYDTAAHIAAQRRYFVAPGTYTAFYYPPTFLPLVYPLGFLPYFPLANGLLTGKYRKGQPAPEGARMSGRAIDEATYDIIESLIAYAEARGRTILDLAVGGLLSKPVVSSVITGATKASQITANAKAAEWIPQGDDAAELWALVKGGETAGH